MHPWLTIRCRNGSTGRGRSASAALPPLLRRKPGAYSGALLDLKALTADPRPELIAPQLWRLLRSGGRVVVIGRAAVRPARVRWLFAPWFRPAAPARSRRGSPVRREAGIVEFRRQPLR